MKRLAASVVIPTTAGPRRILALRHSERLPRSQVYKQSDLSLPLDISGRYHNLVGPNSPLKDWIGLGEGSWRLIVDDDFDTGRSWEAPVAMAHWLREQGFRLDAGDAEVTIWSTGALDVDLNIVEDRQDHYHMNEKIRASAGLFRACAERGGKVYLLIPQGCGEEARQALKSLDGLELIATVSEVSNLPRAMDSFALRQPPVVRNTKIAIGWLALMAAFLGVGGGWTLLTGGPMAQAPLPLQGNGTEQGTAELRQASPAAGGKDLPPLEEEARVKSGSNDTKGGEKATVMPEPVVPQLELIELRAPSGASCAAVFLGSLHALESRRAEVAGRFPSSMAQGLCGLGFRLLDGPLKAKVRLEGALAPYVWATNLNGKLARGGPPWTFNLRLLPERDLSYEIIITYRIRQSEERERLVHHVIKRGKR